MAAVHEMQKEKLGALRDQGGEFKTHLLTQRKKAPIVSLRVLSHKPDPIESVRFSSQKAAFESFGYIFAGGYTFEKIPNYSVIVLTHPEDGTFVGINLHGADEIICTIEAHYPDGSNFSLRDTPLKPGITPPPWHYVQCVPTGTPSELVQRFRSARPPGQKFITPADVPYLLEDSFQLVQQWRIARGGWNREEVAAQLKLTDTPETSDRITQASMDAREKWLFAWLKTEQPEVAKQFEQDFLVIHDELPDYILQMYWVMGTGASISFKDLLENATPIEAFKKLNLAKGAPFQLLAQKTTGFIADFYVAV